MNKNKHRNAKIFIIAIILLAILASNNWFIAYADTQQGQNVIATVDTTETMGSGTFMVEELFTSTIDRIDGVIMYAPEEPRELAPPIAITEPDVLVVKPAEPETLAPPIAPTEHECCTAAICVPATCTTDGYFESVCDCGYTYRKEYPATGHDWTEWHVAKMETCTPGSMVRECSNCGIKEDKVFMDEVNTIYIPELRLNSAFLNTEDGGIGNSDVIYYTVNNHPVITGKLNLEDIQYGSTIYVNTSDGLATYRVEVSEFGISNGTDIIGQTSGTNIWDAQNENDLCMYAAYEDGYWMVIASVEAE